MCEQLCDMHVPDAAKPLERSDLTHKLQRLFLEQHCQIGQCCSTPPAVHNNFKLLKLLCTGAAAATVPAAYSVRAVECMHPSMMPDSSSHLL